MLRLVVQSHDLCLCSEREAPAASQRWVVPALGRRGPLLRKGTPHGCCRHCCCHCCRGPSGAVCVHLLGEEGQHWRDAEDECVEGSMQHRLPSYRVGLATIEGGVHMDMGV